MKKLTLATERIVIELRIIKDTEEQLHGKTPLTYILGRAISRLCLIDGAATAHNGTDKTERWGR